jgi:O-antigen biosynthesis protein
VCWRIQAHGWKVGFAPAALVWHRHRGTTRAYWRQQIGYGEGETWLMGEHPDKFVRGRIDWRGHIYSPLPFLRSLRNQRINAGPFGTAGFPSIYRTDARLLAYLPHSGRWQVAWMGFLAMAGVAIAVRARAALPLLAMAMATLLATVVKCAVYARHSDVSRLPAIGSHSRAASLLAYRLAIGWLHFVQPFARLWGRVRGMRYRPKAHRLMRRVRFGLWSGDGTMPIGDALRALLSLPVETLYWSPRWLDVADFLQAFADRLRQQRAVRQLELDSGWWEDRDLTIATGAWFRVNVRALIEDHGGGQCLHRVAVRSRVTSAAALPLLVAAAAAAVLRYAGLSWATSTAIVGVLALAAGVRTVLRTFEVVLEALATVAETSGMTPLAAGHDTRGRSRRAAHEPAARPELALTTTGTLTEDPSASRVMVGDL